MRKTDHKKILIVSYYLPPVKTVAGIRISNFHTEAKKHFQEIHCLTTSNRHLFPKENQSIDDSNTAEVWTLDLRTLLNKKNRPAMGLNQSTKQSPLIKFISKLSYSFPANIFLEDGGLTYIIGGFFKGKKLIKKNKIEFLFSSYKPYADHLICFLLKKWNPKLIWVADFRDLHVDEIRKNVFLPKLQRWFNKQILKRADIVTTVSKGLAKNLKEFHSNIYVLRNAISSDKNINLNQPSFKKFTFAYTGSIYPDFQTLDPFLKAIQELILDGKIDKKKIQLVYAGKEKEVWMKWINNFDLHEINSAYGLLLKEEAQVIQERSHVNLLLSWANEKQQGILTAKFYDYLMVKNPILLIINGSPDQEFEQIFTDLDCGKVVYNTSAHQKIIKDFILTNYSHWVKTGTTLKTIKEDQLSRFYWDNQMNNFIDYLNSYAKK